MPGVHCNLPSFWASFCQASLFKNCHFWEQGTPVAALGGCSTLWLGSIWKSHPLMPMHPCETENLGYYCITSSMISPLSLKMPNSSFKLQNHFGVTNRNGKWHLSKLVFSCIKRTIKPTSTAVATFRVESIDEMCNWNILKVGTALKTFTSCKRKTWKCHRLINSVWFLNSS